MSVSLNISKLELILMQAVRRQGWWWRSDKIVGEDSIKNKIVFCEIILIATD